MGVASGDREIGGELGAAIWWNDFRESSSSSSSTKLTWPLYIASITAFFKGTFLLRVPNWVQLLHLCTTQKILQRLSFKFFMLEIRVSRTPLALISCRRMKLWVKLGELFLLVYKCSESIPPSASIAHQLGPLTYATSCEEGKLDQLLVNHISTLGINPGLRMEKTRFNLSLHPKLPPCLSL